MVNSTEDSIAEIGSSITLQCIAIGIPNTVEYQWKKNGVLLSQETTQSLVIANISLTDIGKYECIPSNDEGTYNTSVIQLDIRSEYGIYFSRLRQLRYILHYNTTLYTTL